MHLTPVGIAVAVAVGLVTLLNCTADTMSEEPQPVPVTTASADAEAAGQVTLDDPCEREDPPSCCCSPDVGIAETVCLCIVEGDDGSDVCRWEGIGSQRCCRLPGTVPNVPAGDCTGGAGGGGNDVITLCLCAKIATSDAELAEIVEVMQAARPDAGVMWLGYEDMLGFIEAQLQTPHQRAKGISSDGVLLERLEDGYRVLVVYEDHYAEWQAELADSLHRRTD